MCLSGCFVIPVVMLLFSLQSCGTVVSNGYLSKGCVRSDTCHTGCYGETCTLCCQGDMCNQPSNNVITGKINEILLTKLVYVRNQFIFAIFLFSQELKENFVKKYIAVKISIMTYCILFFA